MNITRNVTRNKTVKQLESCRILLIEDQKSIANMTARLLEQRLGCHVTVASTYQAAKGLLENTVNQYFLTISDLNLPDASNGEVIDLLIEHQQAIVAITGFFDQKLHKELSQKGVIDYVLKKNINAYDYLVRLISRLYFNQLIKVLVIDDSEFIQKVTGAYLERQFLTVIYAKNGVEGLALLPQHPDLKLILVDAEMPEMDGLTFTAKARQYKDQNNLCIIGFSSLEKVDLSAQFLKHGANDFIAKPFSYDELTCRVNQNLNMLSYIEEIDRVANLDFLTQLPNRRSFFQLGEPLLKEATEHKQHLVVAIMDIDHFKSINDKYGHDCGDEVLKEVAVSIKTIFKEHIVARIGGEEFGLIISVKNFSESSALIDRFMQSIHEQSISYQNEVIKLTVSIGATYIIKNNLDATLKLADEHLYLAKMAGRNQVVWNHAQPTVS